MLSKEYKSQIEKVLNDELKIYFNSINKKLGIKEAGHSMASQIEDKCYEILIEKGYNLLKEMDKNGKPLDRSFSDFILYNDGYSYNINVKFNNSEKPGQPNICSCNRMMDQFSDEKFNSYYILKVKYNNKTGNLNVYFVDIFDFASCLTFNSGTGQIMLKEKQFYEAYDSNQTKPLSTTERMDFTYALYQTENEKHIKLRTKQGNERKQQLALLKQTRYIIENKES